MLNHFLEWLRKDTKQVKVFARQITSMPTYTGCLRHDHDMTLSRVKLQYRCSDGQRMIEFALDHGDSWTDTCKESPYTPSLYGIPETLRWKIYREALCLSEGVIFDWNTGKRTGIDTGLMFVKQKAEDAPRTVQELFWAENKFCFRLLSRKPLLPSVQIHQEGIQDNWQVLWQKRHKIGRIGTTRLQLTFEIEDNLTLADIRIGIIDLTRLTSTLSGNTLYLYISRTQRQGNGTILERNTISLYALRAQVLKRLAQCTQVDIGSLHSAEFEIFIKGIGKVMKVEWADGDKKRNFSGPPFSQKE